MKHYVLVACLLAVAAVEVWSEDTDMRASFSHLAHRAESGERLTVVFFGGSLTWGANSTDPERTSYRAHVSRRLQDTYPRARWTFIDSAIGGTGSRLGIFRFARDVARFKPDLVFIDHTVNDGGAGPVDVDSMASFEAVIRASVADLHVPTVVMILASRIMVTAEQIDALPIRMEHRKVADAYGCPIGDAVELISDRVKQGSLKLSEVWDNPQDPCHPGDVGYSLYAEAAWTAVSDAITHDCTCHAPAQMIYHDTYRSSTRVSLARLQLRPTEWVVGMPSRISAWYDSLMSRWLDHIVIAERTDDHMDPSPLEFRFRGSTLLLFGERTISSGKIRVLIDGTLSSCLPSGVLDCRSSVGGTIFLAPTLAVGLDPNREHTLKLIPFDDRSGFCEWRLESICIAGGQASIIK